jgi:hypothetical protein
MKAKKLTIQEIKVLINLIDAAHYEKNIIVGEVLLTNDFPSLYKKLTTYYLDNVSVCKFKKIYGFSRPRRKGECPQDCLIDSYQGRRKWGDGCENYVYINKKRARKIVPPTTPRQAQKTLEE